MLPDIDDGIPIPGIVAAGRKARYPLLKLEVGQSFSVPIAEVKKLRNAVHSCKKTHNERQHVMRITGKEVRVWRTK